MKTKRWANLWLACCILALGACATNGSDALTRQSASRQDGAKISAVERSAQQAGTDIVWVNPPERPRRKQL